MRRGKSSETKGQRRRESSEEDRVDREDKDRLLEADERELEHRD